MCINPSKIDGPYSRNNGSAATAATTNKSHANDGCGSSNSNSQGQKEKSSKATALQRMAPLILSGYLFNTLAYFAVVYYAPPFAPYPEFCPATEDSPNNNSCTHRDLFAFQVVSFLNLAYLGSLGTHTFFFSKRSVWWSSEMTETLLPTPQGRFFGKLFEADLINAGIVIFQGWDFMASIFFEEHCTAVMMMHHLLAFICGFFCLVYEVAPYYAVYFGGVSEFSSIFLCLAQIFEFYPPSSLVPSDSPLSTILPNIVTFSQVAFVVTFFAFQIVGWMIMLYKFILDGSFIIRNRLCLIHSPGSEWFLWYLLTTSGLLGALQVFWLREIIDKVLEM